ncbi:hypothetical protein [Aureispira anguillae]|uniref:Uncharacterized protein n=1 Tax=Aureispira anguillae TaxID=2864201 RepID=A0A915YCN3_9BACT|nr:hypothetical protein [Aureispira anguillae]BDS10624.1 hypothetical protein AsAng_0013330 [Aureispira anguillae]
MKDPIMFNPILEELGTSIDGYELYSKAFELMVAQRTALINDDWEQLEKLTKNGLYQAFANWQMLYKQPTSKPLRSFNDLAQRMKKDLEGYLATENDPTSIARKLKAQVLAAIPDIDAASLKKVEELDLDYFFEEDLAALDDAQIEDDNIRKGIEGTVGLAAKSIIALGQVSFYTYSALAKEENYEIYDFNVLLKNIQAALKTIEQDLMLILRTIYANQLTGTAASLNAQKFISKLENWVPKLGRMQAISRNYALFLKEKKKGTKAEQMGRLSAIGGNLLRAIYTTFTAVYYCSLEEKLTVKSEKNQQFIKQTPKVGFEFSFPNGKNVELAKLKEEQDGNYVEIAGFVKSISTRRDADGKLLSHLLLEDPSSGAEIDVVAIYAHLVHLGVHGGSYCQLSGSWRKASAVNMGNPAVEIEKLAINKLAKESWVVLFFDLVDQFIDRWSGGLNLQFGIAPHVSAFEGDNESSILGAGELIFQPII